MAATTFDGGVIDYFGFASDALVPFESSDGTDRPHVVTRHYGRHTADVRTTRLNLQSRITAEQSGTAWRNPYVKYMVVADADIKLCLGTAYAKETGTVYGPYLPPLSSEWRFGNHTGTTKTGYMLTTVMVETGSRHFPVVTMQGVANEGADSINKFWVHIPVVARARAQNLLGAISGGGELQRLVLSATCTPVVCQEYMEPCASDVVDGHYEIHAETLAAQGEGAPTFPESSYIEPDLSNGGFTPLGEPVVHSGTDYARYIVAARKEIV